MSEILPGTEVHARGLRWEIVFSQQLGPQTLFRLRGLEGAVLGRELDLLHPFELVEPVIRELRPERAAPLRNWLVYHQAVPAGASAGRGRAAGGPAGPAAHRAVPARARAARDPHEPAATAAGRRRGAGQDDPGRPDPHRVDRTARRAPYPGRLAGGAAVGSVED